LVVEVADSPAELGRHWKNLAFGEKQKKQWPMDKARRWRALQEPSASRIPSESSGKVRLGGTREGTENAKRNPNAIVIERGTTGEEKE